MLYAGRTSDAKAGAAMAAGIIEAIDFPTSIFIDRVPAFIIVLAVAGTKADADATKRKKAATIFENIFLTYWIKSRLIYDECGVCSDARRC